MEKMPLQGILSIRNEILNSELFFNERFEILDYIKQEIDNLYKTNLAYFVKQSLQQLIELSEKDQNGENFIQYFNLYTKITHTLEKYHKTLYDFEISFEMILATSHTIASKYFQNYFGNIKMFLYSEDKKTMEQIYNNIISDLDLLNYFDKSHYKTIELKFIQNTFKQILEKSSTNYLFNKDDYQFLCKIEEQNLTDNLNITPKDFQIFKTSVGDTIFIMNFDKKIIIDYKTYLFYTKLVQDKVISKESYTVRLDMYLTEQIQKLNYYYNISKDLPEYLSKIKHPIDTENITHYFEVLQIIKELQIKELRFYDDTKRSYNLIQWTEIFNKDTFDTLENFVKKCFGEIWKNDKLSYPKDILFILEKLNSQEFTPENLNLTQDEINTLLLRDINIWYDYNLK